jgi:hypothetical protein
MILCRKVEPVGDVVELPLDGEGTYIAGTQLTAGQAKTDNNNNNNKNLFLQHI